MKRNRLVSVLLFFAVGLFVFAAAQSPPGGGASVKRTGDMGDPSKLMFYGNETFKHDEIVGGLIQNADFLLAGHPVGPLAGYLAAIKEKLEAGYKHSGFAEPEVEARSDGFTGRILVRIEEGPRCMCGKVIVDGVDEAVKEAIVRDLTQPVDGEGLSQSKPHWVAGKPVSFTQNRLLLIKNAVRVTMSEQGYFFPWVDVETVRHRQEGTADLSVQVKDTGPKGTVKEITITGNEKNSDEVILDYLGLKTGMSFDRGVVNRIRDMLRQSGRFTGFKVTPQPEFSKDAKLKLNIEVREYEHAPGLDEDLSALQKTFLGVGQYISGWQEGKDDVIVSLGGFEPGFKAPRRIKLILSPDKGVLVVAWKGDEEVDESLLGALAIGPDNVAYYSAIPGRKFSFSPVWKTMIVMLDLDYSPKPGEDDRASAKFGMGVASGASGVPLRFDISASPCFLMREAHLYKSGEDDRSYSFEEGTLICSGGEFEMRVDMETYRPEACSVSVGKPKGTVTIRTATGAYDKALEQITRASDKWVNEFDDERPISSVLSFLLQRYVEFKAAEDGREKARAAAARFGKVFEKVMPATLDKMCAGPRDDSDDNFTVPNVFDMRKDDLAGTFMSWLSAGAFRLSNEMFARGSWPWTLSRETVFVLGGKGKYSGAVFERLYGSGQMGPLGYLTTAMVMSRISQPVSTAFASRGLERLSVEDFRKDVTAFIEGDSALSRCLIEMGEALRELSDEEVDTLLSIFSDEQAESVRRSIEILRKDKAKPVRQVMPIACDELWRRFLQARVKSRLEKLASRISAKKL